MKFLKFKKQFHFPDGTFNAQLDNSFFDTLDYWLAIQGFSFEELLIKTDCAKQAGVENLSLYIPYLPARQDRVCNKGEPFTAKIAANLINSLGFRKVITLEPHSDVISGMIDRLKVMTYKDVFDFSTIKELNKAGRINLVAPDTGATKRTEKFAQSILEKNPNAEIRIIQGVKRRNLATGEIVEIKIADNIDLYGENCLVVDDVCAMGGTFIGIHEALKKNNAGRISLILAHADAKNGLDKLASIYESIYVTNSQKFDVTSSNIFVTNIFKESV